MGKVAMQQDVSHVERSVQIASNARARAGVQVATVSGCAWDIFVKSVGSEIHAGEVIPWCCSRVVGLKKIRDCIVGDEVSTLRGSKRISRIWGRKDKRQM